LLASPCATFSCGFSAFDIGCSFDVYNLEYTCTCPKGWLTKDGLVSEAVKADQATYNEFDGCYSSSLPSPSLYAIMSELKKNLADVGNGIAQATTSLYSIAITSIDPTSSRMQITMSVTKDASQPRRGWILLLRTHLAHLLNVHLGQVFIEAEAPEKREKTIVLSVKILGDEGITSSASRFGLEVVLMGLLVVSLFCIGF